MTIQDVLKNLIGMEVTDSFKDDVICAFGDYEYEGATEVILTKDESNSNIDYQAYINHADAPIICIKIADGKVADAWEA
jgi:hypothetical protein